jgi:hypothetical protein
MIEPSLKTRITQTLDQLLASQTTNKLEKDRHRELREKIQEFHQASGKEK